MCAKSLFQLLVKLTIVGYPLAVPNLFKSLVKLVKVWQQGCGYIKRMVHFLLLDFLSVAVVVLFSSSSPWS